MIITTLEELSNQLCSSDRIKTAIKFLQDKGRSEIPEGRFEVMDDEVFGYSQRYMTKPSEEGIVYEAHKKYIDIQYIVEGSEMMSWVPFEKLTVTKEYDAEGDYTLGVADMALCGNIPFHSGEVMVMFPDDGHAAGLAFNGCTEQIRKLVVKVALD